MTPANASRSTAATPIATTSDPASSDDRKQPPKASLAVAADGIAARLRSLSERPHSISVRELIERYMAVYTGRDVAIVQRLTTWQVILGDFALEKLDDDVIHAVFWEKDRRSVHERAVDDFE